MRWGGRLTQNLAELSQAAAKEEMKTDQSVFQSQTGSDFAPVSGGAQVPWGLGRLFGASKNPNSPTFHPPPTRLADKQCSCVYAFLLNVTKIVDFMNKLQE